MADTSVTAARNIMHAGTLIVTGETFEVPAELAAALIERGDATAEAKKAPAKTAKKADTPEA